MSAPSPSVLVPLSGFVDGAGVPPWLLSLEPVFGRSGCSPESTSPPPGFVVVSSGAPGFGVVGVDGFGLLVAGGFPGMPGSVEGHSVGRGGSLKSGICDWFGRLFWDGVDESVGSN